MRRFLGWTLLILFVCTTATAEVYTAQPREDWYSCALLRLTFFAAGQSDSILVECGGEAMMVDGGSEPYRGALRDAITARGITHFKYLLNTHFHEDHIMGLYWLMRYGFTADEYLHPYEPRHAQSNALQKQVIEQATRSGIPDRRIGDGTVLYLGEAALRVYRYEGETNANARSLMIHISFGDASALLTADIIGRTQRYFASHLPAEALRSDILKVPHHGVTPVSEPFLDAVSPAVAVVTDSRRSISKTAQQMAGRDIALYCSGDGTVVLETDGVDWYCYQAEP